MDYSVRAATVLADFPRKKGSVRGPGSVKTKNFGTVRVPKGYSVRWDVSKKTYCITGKVGKSISWMVHEKTREAVPGNCAGR